MIIYILMLCSSLFFAYKSTKTEGKLKEVFLIFSVLPFIIVAGIRYDVGVDYMFRYVPDYNAILSGAKIDNLEPLFFLLIKLCQLITNDYWILFFISAIITYILIFKIAYKESDNILLSILILFISSMFFESLNIMRQYIAIAILLLSYKFLFKKGKNFIWLLCVILASLFHSVSLVFLIAPLLKKIKVNSIIYVLIATILGFFGNYIIKFFLYCFKYIRFINLQKYSYYINMSSNFSFSLFIIEIAILLYFMYIIYRKKKLGNPMSDKEKFFINTQYITVLMAIFNVYNELFVRIGFVFSIFQLISIPYFYNISKEILNQKINFKKITIKLSNVLLIFILTLYTSRLVYGNIIKKSSQVLPYKTIFERNVEDFDNEK